MKAKNVADGQFKTFVQLQAVFAHNEAFILARAGTIHTHTHTHTHAHAHTHTQTHTHTHTRRNTLRMEAVMRGRRRRRMCELEPEEIDEVLALVQMGGEAEEVVAVTAPSEVAEAEGREVAVV